MESTGQVVLAADGMTLDQCLELTSKVGDRVYAIKVHNLVNEHSPSVIERIRKAGARRLWVDAKLHDISKTVELRAKAIAESGADILTVHASGGIDMMMAAVEFGPAEIYAVTVLTSLTEEQAHLIYGQPSKAAALYLAQLAKVAGIAGVVSSPKEVGILAKRPELQGLKFVTPGVRSPGKETHDQARVGTITGAIISGSTHPVIGRQVTEARGSCGSPSSNRRRDFFNPNYNRRRIKMTTGLGGIP
jgi:orotidine-5'-phosphate decarboxylase